MEGVAHAMTGTTMVIPLLENCGPRETNSDGKYGNSDNYYYNIMVLWVLKNIVVPLENSLLHS